MKLDVGNVEQIEAPSAEQMRHFMRFMPPQSPFVILSAAADRFIQAAPSGDAYRVEYREQGRQFYAEAPFDLAVRLFESFRIDDGSFKHAAPWRRVTVFNDPHRSHLWALALFCLLCIIAAASAWLAMRSGNDVPAAAMTAMQNADRYELLSLDPNRSTTTPADNFHGWRVLGRVTVTDAATRKKLNDALRAGARESGDPMACFDPRHGIHVVRGERVFDLVICFACRQTNVFEGGKGIDGFLISQSPQPVFDEVFRTAGVPLAEKAR